jgi:hypothetical protein
MTKNFRQFCLLNEGGAAGVMQHPYHIATNGKELVDIFRKSIKSISGGLASLKIDGINVSLRVVDGQFVMDRGSKKDLDVKGIRPEDLKNRFPAGHGLIKIGKEVIEMFDNSFSLIRPELNKLGLLKNPNLLLNIEYVDGKTNVIDMKGKSITIHGILKVIVNEKTGSRDTVEIDHDSDALLELIEKLKPVFKKKYGYEIISNVPVYSWESTALKLNDALSEKYTINGETKTLWQWISGVQEIKLPLINREKFSEYLFSLSEIDDPKHTNDVIIYLTTTKLGDEILSKLSSDMGNVAKHEGIVIRDTTISEKPFKITGSFILKGLYSKFNKKKKDE